jgi:REP element-mobilizing transposase RayT
VIGYSLIASMPINPKYLSPFIEREHYHVYNRCASNRKMFHEDKNYYYFLDLLKKHLLPYIDLFAYALIPNHFHLFIQIQRQVGGAGNANNTITNQFRKLFISYTNGINKRYGTHGGIFSTPFKRIAITNDSYFSQLIYYIHYNAIHHKICHIHQNIHSVHTTLSSPMSQRS